MDRVIDTYELTDEQKASVKKLFSRKLNPCIEQYPGWLKMCYPDNNVRSFIIREGDETVFFAEVLEKPTALAKTAQIKFGPLFTDHKHLLMGIERVVNLYKEAKYGSLTVQLGQTIDAFTELAEYLLNSKFKIRYSFGKDSNWSSIALDLTQTEESIFKNFSKGHKSAIKKAAREGVEVSVISQPEEVEEFSRIYLRMNKARALSINDQDTTLLLKKVYEFLLQNSLGQFFTVKDAHGKMLGGLIVIYQGQTARYYKGAADPEFRHLPILHLGIFEAINHSKKLGKLLFDFWGYNHLVGSEDQRFNINIFKKGFGGDFIFYPKELVFELNKIRLRTKEITAMLYRQVKRN